MRFRDRIAVITGAAGNLGSAVARAFHAEGAKLVLADLSEEALEKRHPDLARAEGVRLVAVDLTREDSVSAMADRTREAFGGADVLANIAGGFHMGANLHEMTVADWDSMIDRNARSVFLASRAILPLMLHQGAGKIVNVSARAALNPKPRMSPYCVSKAAVITLTQCMSAEYKADRINVNCILPGTIDTPENREAMTEADFSKWVSPEALADTVLFLSSDAAAAIHGAAIPVFGES